MPGLAWTNERRWLESLLASITFSSDRACTRQAGSCPGSGSGVGQSLGTGTEGETHSTPVGTFGSESEALDLKTSAGSARAAPIELFVASLSADSAADAS